MILQRRVMAIENDCFAIPDFRSVEAPCRIAVGKVFMTSKETRTKNDIFAGRNRPKEVIVLFSNKVQGFLSNEA